MQKNAKSDRSLKEQFAKSAELEAEIKKNLGDWGMNDWKVITLADCASFQEGYVNPSKNEPSYFGGTIKWLRATDLNNGFVYKTSQTLTEKDFKCKEECCII